MRLGSAVLLLVLTATAHAAHPAIAGGSGLVQGQIGFNAYTRGEYTTSTNLALAPSALFFPVRGFAVGGEVVVNYQRIRTDYFKYNQTDIAFGPKLAYFFGVHDIPVFPYLVGAVMYQRSTLEYIGGSTEDTGIRMKGGLGICPVFGKVAVIIEGGYQVDEREGTLNDSDQAYVLIGLGGFLAR